MYGVPIELWRGGAGDDFTRHVYKLSQCADAPTREELERAHSAYASVYFHRYHLDGPREPLLVLWFGKAVKLSDVFGLSTISHEAVHGAMAVFRDKQIPMTQDSEEPFAYYQTYLFEQIIARLRGVKR